MSDPAQVPAQTQPDWFDANGQQIPPQSTAQQSSSGDWFTENAPDSGQIKNDVGNTVIVPRDNESFLDTMRRAAAQGGRTTQGQIDTSLRSAPGKVATVLGAAPVIGAAGAAGIAASDLGTCQLARGLGYGGEMVKDMLSSPTGKFILQESIKAGLHAGGLGILYKALKAGGIFSK